VHAPDTAQSPRPLDAEPGPRRAVVRPRNSAPAQRGASATAGTRKGRLR
jgi:hypothetical protein